jgi:3-hydroxyacyl-CoA dehydrogenase/3a,7a,12a-trihydroxy-5b-cholest-24-enoyl-CoA hydratase
MKKQNYGRIIMVPSVAGIYGNFGQANYSAAKLGVVGLMNTLAIEGQKNNICVNAVAPMAASRLTQTILPPDVLEALKPEYVAPLMLWLSHEDCHQTGSLFECGAGWISKLRWQRSEGVLVRQPNGEMTPEDVRDNWDKICDFTRSDFPSNVQEANMAYFKALRPVNKGQSKQVKTNTTAATTASIVDAIGAKLPETTFTYSERDAMLYALGVGVSTQQQDHLKFLFEGSDDFSVLPTYAVIPAMGAPGGAMMSGQIKGLQVNPAMIIHGEQYLELYKPLSVSDTLTSSGYIADILDKGSGALIIFNIDSRNSKGERVAFNQIAIFLQQAGGFGGKRTSDKLVAIVEPPLHRKPCATVQERTSVDQAALYRLSGDRNPLHIDPSFAALGGFSSPILHGLCSFGYAARHVLKQFCNNDVRKFKAIKVRFSSPVLPGQTIQTDMWKEGSRVFIQCKVVETGKFCLTGAYVDLHDTHSTTSELSQPTGQQLTSDALFDELTQRIKARPDFAKIINALYLFDITDGANKTLSQWTVDLRSRSAPGSVYRGPPTGGLEADCNLIMSEKDLVDLVTGKLTGHKAMSSGRLSVKGNVMLTLRLEMLFSDKAKL